MRFIKVLSFVLFATISAFSDYLFPSTNPPGNLSPSDVKQYVTLIWDDNGYSGKNFTQYEAKPNATYSSGSCWVGGFVNEGGWKGAKSNDLNLFEGDFGMSWASQTLAGIRPVKEALYDPATGYQVGDLALYNDTIWSAATYNLGVTPEVYTGTEWKAHWDVVSVVDKSRTRTNPDGSDIKFTFNVITGLIIPVWPIDWTDRESKFGSWVPTALDYSDGNVLHKKIAIAWGREQQILATEGGTEFQANYILNSFNDAVTAGHEIGNHTIDHMESNSALSKTTTDYMLDGKDTQQNDVMPWGETIDEAKLYGQTPGASAQTMGWLINAGKIISKASWRSAIDVGEAQLDQYMNISVAKGNLYSFRAPRLEVNSNMFFALKEAGYQYDCGLEEGYEEDKDGTNFVWPYTMDNGSPNVYTQKVNGERLFIDSTPAGFWELPVNCVIVPQDLRPGIFTKYRQISTGAGETITDADSTEWCYGVGGGKITAFDFNMFILWGLSKSEFVEIMAYNLKLRMDNNKAPLQYGCHTDYYTPIYDNATLLNDFNKDSYGLVVSKGWNTWVDRKEAVEQFIDASVAAGAYIITGHDLIEECKRLSSLDQCGTPNILTDWSTFGGVSKSITGSISIDAVYGEENGYMIYDINKVIDHVSLTYKTDVPLLVRLINRSGKAWGVVLNNLNTTTSSGNIPLRAFSNPDKSFCDSVYGIEIVPSNVTESPMTANVDVSDFTIYTGELVGVIPQLKPTTNSNRTNVNIYNASGRVVDVGKIVNGKIIQDKKLPPGMYFYKSDITKKMVPINR